MITIIGSLIGFGTSMLPKVFDMFQDWQDRKQELEIMDRQIKMAEMRHTQKLEQLNVQADIAESKAIYKHASKMKNDGWVGSLRASVRPILTYLFFAVFAMVKGAALYAAIAYDHQDPVTAISLLWDEETAGIFSAIIAFWFGSRTLARK